MTRKDPQRKVAKFWDDRYLRGPESQWTWWGSEQALHYISSLVCSRKCSSPEELNVQVIQERFVDKLPFKTGLSVGCGTGKKEMRLVEAGIVQHMTLYEYSSIALDSVRKSAEEKGYSDRITCIHGDAFNLDRSTYDLIFWENALHHMLDVHVALIWSRNRLKQHGVFYMNDFVGESRFQWRTELLEATNSVMDAVGLPPVYRPSRKAIIAHDESEAADSERIQEELMKVFPNATWTPTGGAVYFVALTGFRIEIPDIVLKKLLHFDALLNQSGKYVYAVATAVKE